MVIAARRGWLCDDAFISFRYADNFVHGRGLVFNVGDRVQGFTNPLWVLVYALPHAIPGDVYAKGMLFSLLVSAGAASALAWGFSRNPFVGAAGAFVLGFSEAAGDFATSGLENPLSHVLLLAFAASFLAELSGPRRTPFRALAPWLCAGLALTVRIDLLPSLAPGLFVVALAQRRRLSPHELVRTVALGLSPFLAWALFATVYYGSPVPNTAIAKLGVSLPRNEVLGQGLRYLFVTVERDPLTVFVLVAGIVCGCSRRVTRPLALGVLLQVVYVVWVGGDFMAGRFLTAPFYLALTLCVTLLDALDDAKVTQTALAVAAFVAVLSPYRPFEETPSNREVPTSGIVSEREFYGEELGLGVNLRKRAYRRHSFYRQGVVFRKGRERFVYFENAGLAGYAAGPKRHLVDAAGLTDAFLARMPRETQREWRIAHYGRKVPAGYLRTLRTGKMRLTDARHRELYRRLQLITRGTIFSAARLEAIVWMHLNRFGVES